MKSIISAYGKENRLEQEFLWYPSNNGSDGKHRRASDCYLFRPSKLDAIPIKKSKGPEVKTFLYEGIRSYVVYILRMLTSSYFIFS